MPERDRKIADSGWGIKPDDQPANTREVADATRVYKYDRNDSDALRKILLAQRKSFNTANKARVEADRTVIIDINKDEFVVEGLGFGDDNLIELLQRLGAAFNPQELRQVQPGANVVRQYDLSRAWAWGAERSGG